MIVMISVIVIMEKILYRMVDFLMGFTHALRHLMAGFRDPEPVAMDVDLAHFGDGGDPQQGVDVTKIMTELAEQAQRLAMSRAELDDTRQARDHALGHQERLQGELDRAREGLRDLRRDYDAVQRALVDLRTSVRRHQEKCPNGHGIFISKHGRRWHYTRGCEHFQFPENIVELQPCSTCTGSRAVI